MTRSVRPHGALQIRLRPGSGAVRSARHAVLRWAREEGADAAAQEVIALLTTELVSNAVRHGPRDGEVGVLASRTSRGSFRVEVSDDSPARPVLRDQPPSAVGGRGIHIVDRMAQEWGVRRRGDGKTVWFAVAG